MKKIFYISLVFLFFAQAGNAAINKADGLDVVRWYKVYWSGIHIADLKAAIKDGGFDAVIDSYGIVKSVSKYNSKTKTKFDYKNGEYVPVSFFNKSAHRHGSRTINIKYKNDGKVFEEAVTPPDNRAKRPAVADSLKNDAVDPLTAIMVARQKIKESLANGDDKFSMNMYDGRRLARLDFNIVGRKTREIKGDLQNIVEVTFKRFALEGFTQNELRRMEGEEPLLTMYLSDDDRLLPIKVDAEARLGTAVLLFEKDCNSLQECV